MGKKLGLKPAVIHEASKEVDRIDAEIVALEESLSRHLKQGHPVRGKLRTVSYLLWELSNFQIQHLYEESELWDEEN